MRRLVQLLAAVALVPPLAAQIDYRNLDDDRPLRVEDAYAIEWKAFEVVLPWFSAHGGPEPFHYAIVPELVYGFIPGGALGFKLPLAGVSGDSADRFGMAGVKAFALVNLTTETRHGPGLALRLDAAAAAGSLAGRGSGAAISVLATRSFGRHRVHVNASWGFATQDEPAIIDPVRRWWAGLAVDRTLIRSSTLVLGGLTAGREAGQPDVRWEGALGVRRQLTPTLVLDAGAAARLKGPGEDVELTLGLTHTFAVAALMRGGRP